MKKVVVIDDDADVRDVVVFALESDGHKVEAFENGEEGLNALLESKDAPPGIIMVDYLMPQMDGLSFIHELRTKHDERFSDVPIAIMSAIGDLDQSVSRKEKIILFQKPMDLEDLLRLVREHCS